MCGIVGVINLANKRQFSAALLEEMTQLLAHRGPDESGIYVDHRVAFGQRRLRIIDLSPAGRQPMFDAGGQVGIVFNGEIYNYGELRPGLIQRGYTFKSQSDTEVILNAYRQDGIDCIQDFIGMFAFAIYDTKTGKVFIVRDRLGIKPLYYAQYDGKLLFASEMKSLLHYPGFPRSADPVAISSYLSYRYPVGTRTFFKDIRSLPPGHYLEIDGDKLRCVQYWDVPRLKDKPDHGEAWYVERIRELLESAVKYRMISDVPVGAYLSGGLDSSIVVALMASLANKPVKTFTIGFEEQGFNEFGFAKQVVERFGTDHHEIVLPSEDYIENMRRLVRFKDAPLSVPNEPAIYVMSKHLKEFITVVLSGEGADELFGGYGRIFRSPFDYQRMKSLLNGSGLQEDEYGAALSRNLLSKYGDKPLDSELDHFLSLYTYMPWAEKAQYLSADVVISLNRDRELNAFFSEHFDSLEGMSQYDKYMWMFEKIHLVGLLHRLDTTTMATAVEGRVPFVDHRLVELAQSIPVEHKLRWKSAAHKAVAGIYNSDQISEVFDDPKYILKKAFEKNLPPDVVWRKKMGFPVPIHQWLGNDFHSFACDLLTDKRAEDRGIYNVPYLREKLANKALFSEHRFGLKMWMMVNLELWFREYIN